MTERNPEDLRRRLVEIDDELRELPSDAFARKHELNTEGDNNRKLLADALAPELRAIGDDWADRSARKASHTANADELAAKASMAKFLTGEPG